MEWECFPDTDRAWFLIEIGGASGHLDEPDENGDEGYIFGSEDDT